MFERYANKLQTILDNLRDTATNPSKSLLNAFLLSTYFLCSRFLILNQRSISGVLSRDSVDLMTMQVDRVGEEWAPLVKKLQREIMRDAGSLGQ